MSHVTGLLIIDAPASALNNAGQAKDERNNNVIVVKLINTHDGVYPYVSAQAIRYWLRTGFADVEGWTTPTFRDEDVSYTSADPVNFAEDDLFGYMRAPTGMDNEKRARESGLTPMAEERRDGKTKPVSVTRISPFRVGTAVATFPVKGRPTRDWGTMVRAEGPPVIHLHDFYRAHLKAPIAIDLPCIGTFFVSGRVGYKNLDGNRIEAAKAAGAEQVKVRGFDAVRLPLDIRRARVAQLIAALGRMEGGAKQTLHLTDTAPSVLVLAVCKSGNQPFQRLFSSDDFEHTIFRTDVFEEALKVFADDIQSPVYVGWTTGFLDAEKAKLEALLKDGKDVGSGRSVHLRHPREIADEFAAVIRDNGSAVWFE